MADAPCRAIIADDEPIARRGLRRALLAEDGIELVAMCRSGAEALAAIRAHRPDLALLDVAMPALSGVDVLRGLEPAERPAVIFVTAFDRFAIDAFDLHAVDYLLKPFDQQRFHVAIERARSRLRNGAARTADLRSASLAGLLEVFASRDRSPARIAVKQGDRVILIPVDDITHCEAADNYVRVHAQGKKYLVRETMQAFERRLGSTFARIHRSAIVNLSRVHEVRPLFHGDCQLLLDDRTALTLSRTYRDTVIARLQGGPT